MPEELKIQYRAAISALNAGLGAREAAQAARAEVARWRDLQAPLPRDDGAKAVIPVEVAQPATEAAPVAARVRLL